jgi:hypothetical protein
VIVATHDLAVVSRYGSRCVRLEGGRVSRTCRRPARARDSLALLRFGSFVRAALRGIADEPAHEWRGRGDDRLTPVLAGAFALLVATWSGCSRTSASALR